MPMLSVIMPVYNNERYVEQAIESVLDQTYRDFELIVTDDGSTDHSFDIASRLQRKSKVPFHLIRLDRNRGISTARNVAIERSNGQFLVFADSDDIQMPDRLERSVSRIKDDPKLDMMFFDCEMMDAEGRPLHRNKGYPDDMNADNALLHQLRRNHLWIGLSTIRKTPDIRLDPDLQTSEDYDLFFRLLLKNYRLAIVREPVLWYRLHQSNNSGDGQVSRQSVIRILNKLDFDDLHNRLQAASNPDAMLALASAALTAELPAKAMEYLVNCDAVSGALETERCFLLGVCCYKTGDPAGSRQAFERVLQLDPRHATALNNLGVLLAMEHLTREAGDLFQQALTLRPGYMDAQHNLHALGQPAGSTPLRLTEKPLRANLIHTDNYKL